MKDWCTFTAFLNTFGRGVKVYETHALKDMNVCRNAQTDIVEWRRGTGGNHDHLTRRVASIARLRVVGDRPLTPCPMPALIVRHRPKSTEFEYLGMPRAMPSLPVTSSPYTDPFQPAHPPVAACPSATPTRRTPRGSLPMSPRASSRGASSHTSSLSSRPSRRYVRFSVSLSTL